MTRDGQILYSRGFRGADNAHTQFSITSCSKWLIASTLMNLVDDGRLELDDPVIKYLPSFGGRKASITIRHLLSHTSGLPRRLKNHKGIAESDLAKFVKRLGKRVELLTAPGKRFCYGNLSYQVAVRVAEVIENKPFHAIFKDRIATPCKMNNTRFPISGLGHGVSSATSTTEDFSKFLTMFKNEGVSANGTRVLSANAVQEMIENQTFGIEMGCVNRAAHQRSGRVEYGLGLWRERVDPITKKPTAVSHFGTAGFRGVINFAQNYIMVLGIQGKTFQKKQFLTHRFQETLNLIDSLDFGDMP